MAINLPADYDAGVVQLHEDGSFTVTARIAWIRLKWDRIWFEAEREEGDFRGVICSSRENAPPDLLAVREAGETALRTVGALHARNGVSVPSTVKGAEGGNTNSAFRLTRLGGVTTLETMRGRNLRYFMYLPDASGWIETDSRELCNIWNSNLKSPTSGRS